MARFEKKTPSGSGYSGYPPGMVPGMRKCRITLAAVAGMVPVPGMRKCRIESLWRLWTGPRVVARLEEHRVLLGLLACTAHPARAGQGISSRSHSHSHSYTT